MMNEFIVGAGWRIVLLLSPTHCGGSVAGILCFLIWEAGMARTSWGWAFLVKQERNLQRSDLF